MTALFVRSNVRFGVIGPNRKTATGNADSQAQPLSRCWVDGTQSYSWRAVPLAIPALIHAGPDASCKLQEEVGHTPAQLLARLRMEAACALLEQPTMTVKQAARQSGYGTEYNLRRAFVAQLGVLPRDYHSRFAGDDSRRSEVVRRSA